MPLEQSIYEGRKGQKRFRTIEKHINRVKEDFDRYYENCSEMIFMKEELRWEEMSKLIFIMAQRSVHFKWSGLRDYGFIRLCKRWMVDNEVDTVTSDIIIDAIRDILPSEMCFELKEELTALEIS